MAFVSSVGLNEPTKAELAIDPDAPPAAAEPRRSEAGGSGPQLEVRRLGERGDGRVSRNGRMRLPKG